MGRRITLDAQETRLVLSNTLQNGNPTRRRGHVPTSAVVLRSVLQKRRNVASKRANPRNGCFKEEIGRKRGPGRKGGGGKVNLPPYRCLVHADESANPKHNVQDLAKRP